MSDHVIVNYQAGSLTPKPDAPSEAAGLIGQALRNHQKFEHITDEWSLCCERFLALAIDAHTRKRLHEEWLVTHAQHEAALAKKDEALRRIADIADIRGGVLVTNASMDQIAHICKEALGEGPSRDARRGSGAV